MRRQLRVDQGTVAEQQEFHVGMPHQSESRAWNDDRCTEIAAHGIKRDSNLLRHKTSWKPDRCGLEIIGRELKAIVLTALARGIRRKQRNP
jgi:hypothetical protein